MQEVSNAKIVSLSFEVFGKVQGVFFRKATVAEAVRRGISGWCRNSASGSVHGEIEGYREAIDAMKHWLQNVGSPKAKIDKCVFSTETESTNKKFNAFTIRK